MRFARRLSVAAVALVASARGSAQGTTPPNTALTLKEMAAMSAAVSPEITLTAKVENGAFVLTYGPLDLPAHAGHHGGMPEPPPRWITVPVEGWLHGYSVEIVDEKGAQVPKQTLHHVNVIATQQRELFSPIMLRVAAAGSETGDVSLPRLVGLRTNVGDTLLVRAMLHNPTGRDYKGVRVIVRFPLTKSDAFIGAFRIQPFYLDVTPPAGSHVYDLPPGHSEHFWESRPAIDARVLGIGGHAHKYAKLLRFEDRTANSVIWEAKPDTDATGEIRAIPITRYLARLGYAIKADHTYRFTAIYDNPTGATIPDGGMGALGGVVLISNKTPWPHIDPQNADYKLDVWAMWRP